MKKVKVMVIIGSVRQNRAADGVIEKLKVELDKHQNTEWEIVDLKDMVLPFFNEPQSPNMIAANNAAYLNKDGQAWAERVGGADGFIIVTPEYNHSFPAVLKNAIDWVGPEWNHKPVTFVSYGAMSGGTRAVEQLRQVVIELRMHPLHDAVHIPHVYAAFNESGEWNEEAQQDTFAPMIDELEKFLQK